MSKALIVSNAHPSSNHLEAVKKWVEESDYTFQPGELSHVDVLHDDWCGILNGGLRCECNPEVVIRDKRAVRR